MEKLLNSAIESILNNNKGTVSIAIQQRAKFEGWLKFELAHELKKNYADTVVEYYFPSINAHVDIYSNQSLIELKTSNTSYKIPNCKDATRPITKNVNDIISDINKLKSINQKGSYKGAYIAFVMFPLNQKTTYQQHVNKIKGHIKTGKIVETKITINGVDLLIFTAKVFQCTKFSEIKKYRNKC